MRRRLVNQSFADLTWTSIAKSEHSGIYQQWTSAKRSALSARKLAARTSVRNACLLIAPLPAVQLIRNRARQSSWLKGLLPMSVHPQQPKTLPIVSKSFLLRSL